MEKIPIVFATENEFAKLTGVAISSIIQNMSQDFFYDINILYTRLSEDNIYKLEKNSTDRVSIKCINVTEYINFEDLYEINQYTYEIYYRYYATKILKYNKFIYLDSDIIVVDDIAKLYQEPIGNAPIAVVTDYTYYVDSSKTDFNSGVMLINSKEFENLKIREKCIELIKKGTYNFPDQDALNEICRENAFILNPKYNYQISMIYQHKFKKQIKKKKYKKLFSQEPIIIHFSYVTKPFKNIYSKYSKEFWEYAKKTAFYGELVDNFLENPYKVLRSSPIPDIYIDMAEEGKIGMKGILEVFFYQLKYWFLYKIRKVK